jgi:hypothetical protein
LIEKLITLYQTNKDLKSSAHGSAGLWHFEKVVKWEIAGIGSRTAKEA